MFKLSKKTVIIVALVVLAAASIAGYIVYKNSSNPVDPDGVIKGTEGTNVNDNVLSTSAEQSAFSLASQAALEEIYKSGNNGSVIRADWYIPEEEVEEFSVLVQARLSNGQRKAYLVALNKDGDSWKIEGIEESNIIYSFYKYNGGRSLL